jgi:hypothetical protein
MQNVLCSLVYKVKATSNKLQLLNVETGSNDEFLVELIMNVCI